MAVTVDEEGAYFYWVFVTLAKLSYTLITRSELQARALSQINSGNKCFASDDEIRADIKNTSDHMDRTFDPGSKALVNLIHVNDGLARFIGWEPNDVKYLFTVFKMWLPMVFASYNLVNTVLLVQAQHHNLLGDPFLRLCIENGKGNVYFVNF